MRSPPIEVVTLGNHDGGDGSHGRSATRDAVPESSGSALDTVAAALGRTMHALGSHVGAFYLLPPGAEVLELAAMVGLPAELIAPWEHVGLATPLPVPDAIRRDRLVWVCGEEEMVQRYPRLAVALPYDYCMAALPVADQDTVHGAFFLCWPPTHPDRLDADERAGLAELAAEAGRLLRGAGLAAHPPCSGGECVMVVPDGGRPGSPEAQQAMLARLPDGVVGMDLRGRVVYVTEGACELLRAPAARLMGERPWSILPWLRDPVYEDRYRAALVTRQPTSFVAMRPPDRWLSFQLHPDATGLTASITPARVAPADLPAAVPTAHAVPMRAGALYHILHLASALTEAVGVQDVVRLVAEQIAPAFGGQAVALLVTEGGRLRNIAHRGYPPGVVERFASTPLTAPTPGVQALTSGVPAFFASREELERVYPLRVELQDSMSAWAYLPMVASGRLVGTCVLAFAQPHEFAVEERWVLTSVGGLIAQALDRARVYDAKSELAHGLQESLLPHALPLLPGLEATARYLPGTEGMDIGGDFYDVIRLERHTAGAVIGDVQGHNVTAAALMGQIRTAVHAYARAGTDPGAVLTRTNRLMADLDTSLLASCTYLRLDLARRRAALAIAGHPRPLLRDREGRVLALESRGGMLLGIDPRASYPVTRLPLPVGTTVALYTDGLVEDPGTDLDEGVGRLCAQLARHGGEPLEILADILTAHAEQAEHRTDDTALLLLRSMP